MSAALAVVMGDIDLVHALALARVRSALFAEPGAPARLSRHVVARLPWRDHWRDQDAVAAILLEFARTQDEPPVLMPQTDGDLLAVSRQRARLAGALRFALPAAELVEALVDKERFAEMARELDLPVPPSRRLDPARTSPGDVDLRFPLVVKPLVRDYSRWARVDASAKAIEAPTPAALSALWPRLAELRADVLAQELVPGPESAVESHHAYVDESGTVVAEFTGQKVRTRPNRFGNTTALRITARDDVAALGREVLAAVGLRGVAKVDFKRAPDGRLHLLEVNPRFNLWHHPAALAGVNLPALVYDDLTGRPRRTTNSARAGVQWCYHLHDALAARENGVPLRRWLPWALRADAKSDLAWDDPLPFIRGVVWPQLRRRVLRA